MRPDLETMVGTLLRTEGIWSDVQTRVGTPHKALEQLGWGHRTTLRESK